ncbi:hypothetical protein CBI38_36830 (plasmid) [Rhodococcus oxybenzonivorans]|uniref:Uncharacterized protein n=1 Tax=Rhodococcus oxybenzonivorans TaxID=1990687 RepID=A0A2S2C7W7_9NOCA|nr:MULTISPECIES: hypothetical protein [Rhodococcus]AWK76975.1 hypothetical protein CBI38_36830 [Rhodococcus oxybenzonivorans]QTJ71279.1 hypothetical protein HYG77_38185 [Rhodococcus sp. ZPP]
MTTEQSSTNLQQIDGGTAPSGGPRSREQPEAAGFDDHTEQTDTGTDNPIGIEANPISSTIDGLVDGVEIWTYGQSVILDRDDAFTLVDRLLDALRNAR